MEEVVMKFAAVVLIVERYMMLASDWLQASGPCCGGELERGC